MVEIKDGVLNISVDHVQCNCDSKLRVLSVVSSGAAFIRDPDH